MVTIDQETLLRSANAHMLRSGAAYHLAYTSLQGTIRNELQKLAVSEREQRLGDDATRAFTFRGLGSICERGSLVFPKLFRRCVRFCQEQHTRFVASEFVQWLAGNREHDDEVAVGGRRVRMSGLLSGGRELVRCRVDPMGIAFVPKG